MSKKRKSIFSDCSRTSKYRLLSNLKKIEIADTSSNDSSSSDNESRASSKTSISETDNNGSEVEMEEDFCEKLPSQSNAYLSKK